MQFPFKNGPFLGDEWFVRLEPLVTSNFALGRWYVTLWTSRIRQCSSLTFWSSNLQSKHYIKISKYLVSIHVKMELLSGLIIYSTIFWLDIPIFSPGPQGGFGFPRYSTPEIRTAVPCGLPFHLRGSAFGSGVQFAGPWNPEKWGCWDGWVVWVSEQWGENWWHLDVFWEIREVWLQFCGFCRTNFCITFGSSHHDEKFREYLFIGWNIRHERVFLCFFDTHKSCKRDWFGSKIYPTMVMNQPPIWKSRTSTR